MLLNSKKTSKICGLFLKNNAGAALVEMALVVPLLFTIVFATIEFGNYYIRAAIVQRNATQVASYIQTALPNSTAADANSINNAVINMVGAGMTICANTGANQQNPNCGPNASVGRANAGVPAQSPYVVQIVVWQAYNTLTGISTFANFQFPNQIVARASITVAAEAPTAPSASCGPFDYITYDLPTNSYSCVTDHSPIPPNCTSNDEALHYSGGAFTCVKLTGFQPNIIDCNNDDGSINGLKWNSNSHKYNCVKLAENPNSTCDQANTYDGGDVQFVQWDGTNYTCRTLAYSTLKGEKGDKGDAGQDGNNGGGGNLQIFSGTGCSQCPYGSGQTNPAYHICKTKITDGGAPSAGYSTIGNTVCEFNNNSVPFLFVSY